jgi:hypothetical protein
VTSGAKECAKVEGLDTAIVVAVDATVGRKGAEVETHLELTLEDVKTAHKVDLLLKDVEQGALDVVRKRVETTDVARRAVQSHVPQEVVSAG